MKYPSDFKQSDRLKPICGVLAVAVAAGCSLVEAEAALRKFMPSHRSRWTGTTYHSQRLDALRHLGVHFSDKCVTNRMNLGSVTRNLGGHFIISVTGHVVTFKDSLVLDQAECLHYEHHWARRKFVVNLTEIL